MTGREITVACDDVVHVFTTASKPTIALQRVHLTVTAGETVAVTGPSGSGKSTLLAVLSGALPPSAGTVKVLGHDPRARGTDRLRTLGVILQSPSANLLPHATARQNVMVVMRAAGRGHLDRHRVERMLTQLRIDHVRDTAAQH